MTDRILPPEEWHRLPRESELAQVLHQLDPQTTTVVVVEDEAGQIVGCWAAVTVIHAEGVWIDPAHRQSSVALRLWRRMSRLVRGMGRQRVLTGAHTPEIAELLNRKRALPLPYQEYVLCL